MIVINFLKGVFSDRKLLIRLAINDFKVKYTGSYLGIIWGFIQPAVTILIYWFVFQIGFRSGSRPDGTPFILWLISGIIPWFFFSEALISSTNSLLEYSYLVKKVAFRISVLPLVKILSSLMMHFVFVAITIAIFVFSGNLVTIHYVQLFYYLVCTIYLLLGLSWLTSALVVFVRDISQIVAIIIQMGFWMIPIVWSQEILAPEYRGIFEANPVYYIVVGYRNSFLGNGWFMDDVSRTLQFWGVSTFIVVIGAVVFKKLKPHFSDVL